MDCQSCLICRSVSSTETVNKVNKLDALFLLQIVFEIPHNSYLVKTLTDVKLKIIKVCEQCSSLIRQCKDVYGEIGRIVKRFWQVKKKIVGNAATLKSGAVEEEANANCWTAQFRTFVKHHEFKGAQFPFVVQDLETLAKCNLSTQSSADTPEIKVDVVTEGLHDNPDDQEDQSDDLLVGPFPSDVEISNVVIGKLNPDKLTRKKVETGNEASEPEDDEDEDNFEFKATPFNPEEWTKQKDAGEEDSSEEDESSEDESREKSPKGNPFKKSRIKYGLKRDPKTLRYHCLETTCDKSSVCSAYIRKHYEAEHLKIRKRKVFRCEWPGCEKTSVCKTYITKHYEVDHAKTKQKERYPCKWPGCGKTLGDKAHFEGHMDQHKGTPKWKCKKCGETFFWRKYWFNHEKNKLCKLGDKPKKKTETFDCNWPGCGKRFVDRGVWMCHMSRRKGTPKKVK